MARPRDWAAAALGVLILADALDAPIATLFGKQAMVIPDLPVARLLLPVVVVTAALLLAGDRRAALASIRRTWPVWPALALAFASIAWSDRPRASLLWSLALLATTAFGAGLDRRFTARAQAALVAVVVSAIAALSVVAALLFKSNRLSRGGRWSGLYLQKNLLGRVMALGTTAAAAAVGASSRRRDGITPLLLCGGVLVATRSKASLLATAVTLAVVGCLLAARAYRSAARPILVGGALTILATVLFLIATTPGLRLLNRSATFNERTHIWRVVTALGGEAPWLGHGYGAFWTGPAGGRALEVLHLRINHAHNGAVDLYAELGVVGLVAVIVPLAWTALAALRHALRPGSIACLWPATYIVFFIASNAAESALLRHKIYWALFVAVLCHLVRHRSPDAPVRRSAAVSA